MSERALVRPAQYARHRGVSRQAVHMAIKRNRIPTHHGLVDPEEADRAWAANTDPGNPTNSETGAPAIAVPLAHRAPVGEDPGGQALLLDVPQTTRRAAAVDRQKRNGDARGTKGKETDGTQPYGAAFIDARARREATRAEIEELTLKKMSGEYISAEKVYSVGFTIARNARDAIEGLPDRVAPVVAGMTNQFEVRKLLHDEFRAILKEMLEELQRQIPHG